MHDLQNTKLKRVNIGKDYVKMRNTRKVLSTFLSFQTPHPKTKKNSSFFLLDYTFSIFFAFFSLSLFLFHQIIHKANPATWWLSSIDSLFTILREKTMSVEVRSRVFDQEAGSTLASLRDGDPSTQRGFRCIPYELDLNPLRIVRKKFQKLIVKKMHRFGYNFYMFIYIIYTHWYMISLRCPKT